LDASHSFDDDGVATRPNVFVENGVLKNYSLGVYSARKLGMKTTGNAGGMHNLIIQPGNKDLHALLKTMDKGLLITEMMGQGVNLVTGDYSRGATGFWIEHGEIQYPVHEITVAGKLQEAYQKMIEIIESQGGKEIEPEDIKIGKYSYDFLSTKSGVVADIDNVFISRIARIAGAPHDKGAGIYLYKHLEDKVKKDEKLFTIYAESNHKLEYAKDVAKSARLFTVK